MCILFTTDNKTCFGWADLFIVTALRKVDGKSRGRFEEPYGNEIQR